MKLIDPLASDILVSDSRIVDREAAKRQREWGLTRIIFIDSYSEGRVVEFDVAGGSALAGRNGEGKTALLSILPLFHGEQPNRLVKKEENRQSLATHYLSRQTSYIIFEYAQHQGQMRMSVMSASPSSDAVEVMLVRSGYEDDIFTREDGSWVQRTSLKAALTSKGLSVNGWYDLAQYRRILHRIKSGRETAHLAELYAVTVPGTSLGGIERIVSGMFKRATKFDEIANIVVREVMTDDGDSMTLGLDREAVEKWREDYAAYRDVESHRDLYGTLRNKSVQRNAARSERREAKLRLNAFIAHARLKVIEIASELKMIADTKAALEGDRERNNACKAELLSLRATIHQMKEESKQFVLKEREYHESGIEKAADDLKRIPELNQDIDVLRNRIKALEGDVNDLNAKYADMASTQRHLAAERLREIHRDAQAGLDPLREKLQTGQQELEKLIAAHEQELQSSESEHEAIIERAMSERAIAKAQSDHPSPSAQAKSELDAAVREHKIAEDEDRAATHAHDEAERNASRINERLAILGRDLDASNGRLAEIRGQLRVAAEKVEGPVGSVLRWARDNAPEKVEDLTKVLTDSVLLRQDLDPSDAGEGQASIFGIRIDASRIAGAAAGQRESAEQEFETLQRAETLAIEDAKTKEGAIQQSKSDLKAAQRLCKTTATAAALTPSKLKASLAAMRAKEDALRRNEAQAKEDADSALAIADARVEEVRSARDADRVARRQTMNDLREAWSSQRSRINSDIDRINAELQRDIGASEGRLDQVIAKIAEERDVELRSRNIDVDALTPLRQQLVQLGQRKTLIEKRAREVARWEVWRESEPEKHHLREQKMQVLLKDEIALDAGIKTEEARIKTKTTEADRLEKEATNRKVRFENDASRIEQLLSGTNDLHVGVIDAWRPEEDLGSIQTRAFEAGAAIEKLTKDIDRGLRILHDAFTRHQGTSLGGALAEDVDGDNIDDDELAPYTRWYDDGHVVMKSQMIIQARNIIRIVGDFHAGLRNFDLGVRRFNREIQESLNQTSVFESLTGLEVTISTTYDQMKWWKIVDAANDKGLEVRGRIDANELPDPEYTKVLEDLMATWREGAGLRAELRRIVDIRGHVMDKGERKTFSRDTDLTKLSSNGLSYLILASILTAFVDRIRGASSKTTIIWAIDELRDLDGVNVTALVRMLATKNIEIVSAFTAADSTYMKHFANRYAMMSGRRIQKAILRDRDAERIHRRSKMENAHA